MSVLVRLYADAACLLMCLQLFLCKYVIVFVHILGCLCAYSCMYACVFILVCLCAYSCVCTCAWLYAPLRARVPLCAHARHPIFLWLSYHFARIISSHIEGILTNHPEPDHYERVGQFSRRRVVSHRTQGCPKIRLRLCDCRSLPDSFSLLW